MAKLFTTHLSTSFPRLKDESIPDYQIRLTTEARKLKIEHIRASLLKASESGFIVSSSGLNSLRIALEDITDLLDDLVDI